MATQRTPTERYLTPAGVAALVFVDPKTVSRWAKAGKIPCTCTPGGHRRFLQSDVAALMSNRGQDYPHNEGGSASFENGTTDTLPLPGRLPGQRGNGSVKRASMPTAHDAERAALKARRARAFAAAEAARVIANEAASAAAAMRSRATAQAGCRAEAAAQAKRLICSLGTGPQPTFAARMTATLEAAADAASADTDEAAARVAQAVTDAAGHVAVMVAAFDLSMERETAAAAQALHNLTVETARHLAQRNGAAARRALPLRSLRT